MMRKAKPGDLMELLSVHEGIERILIYVVISHDPSIFHYHVYVLGCVVDYAKPYYCSGRDIFSEVIVEKRSRAISCST